MEIQIGRLIEYYTISKLNGVSKTKLGMAVEIKNGRVKILNNGGSMEEAGLEDLTWIYYQELTAPTSYPEFTAVEFF